MKTVERQTGTPPSLAEGKPWRALGRRWTNEFPYGWPSDAQVNRRQVLRWAVGLSGALFAMTGVLAALGFGQKRAKGGAQQIVAANAIPVGGVHYFHYPGSSNTVTANHAMVLRLDETHFVAYGGKCTHLSCAVWWEKDQGHLVCPCHNGHFDPATGDVLFGPPTRPLPVIELENRNGMLYALREVIR